MYRRNYYGKIVPVDKPFYTTSENYKNYFKDSEDARSDITSQVSDYYGRRSTNKDLIVRSPSDSSAISEK